MKKFLCFIVILCLALAPAVAFADDYENGEYEENGYEDADEYDADEYEADEYENGEEADEDSDDADEEDADYDDEDEDEYVGIEAISEVLGQAWNFGMGYELGDDWYAMQGDIDAETGVMAPIYIEEAEDHENAILVWTAPFAGRFYVTGLVLLEGGALFTIGGDDNKALASGNEDYEIHYDLQLEAGERLFFITAADEDSEYPSANWNIVIREIPAVEEDEEDEEEAEEYEEDEEELVEIDPLADLDVLYVMGNAFVAFRDVAVAFGFENTLVWYGETNTVGFLYDGSFWVGQYESFNDNGRIYVPFAVIMQLIGDYL